MIAGGSVTLDRGSRTARGLCGCLPLPLLCVHAPHQKPQAQ